MHALAKVTLVACVLGVSPDAGAQEMPVPPNLQAALFKKIFDYDRTLPAGGSVRVAVVHGGDGSVAGVVASAFSDGGIDAIVVFQSDLPGQIEEFSVVYVTPGTDATSIAALCAAHGVLSVSGLPELAVQGEVAVGIGIHEQKPEILVNLKRVKIEGHELAAELLNLARVIR